jgi:hypothetical protein
MSVDAGFVEMLVGVFAGSFVVSAVISFFTVRFFLRRRVR